jgi:hypothetical protein
MSVAPMSCSVGEVRGALVFDTFATRTVPDTRRAVRGWSCGASWMFLDPTVRFIAARSLLALPAQHGKTPTMPYFFLAVGATTSVFV